MNTYAPVIIPTLNRFDHFKVCLESLEACTGSDRTDVYVGLDYPPSDKYFDGWKKIDEYLHIKEHGNNFKSFTVLRHNHNLGAWGKGSNSDALQSLVQNEYGRWIYTEDDNIFSRNFLLYMNACLEKYRDDSDVISISGYSYPVPWKVSDNATCLKQNAYASCFGVGFWKDKYFGMQEFFRNDGLLNNLQSVVKEKKYLNMINACRLNYFDATCLWRFWKDSSNDLFHNCSDVAMRCYMAINDKYTISPLISKVRNIGFDGSGKTCQNNMNDSSDNAVTYCYSKQPIDQSDSFEIVEDTFCKYDENREIVNTFDFRSKKTMYKTLITIWICEQIGCTTAKVFNLCVLPFNTIQMVWERIKRFCF